MRIVEQYLLKLNIVKRKLVRAAESYLRSQEYDFEYRFDIITVTGNEQHHTLDHIEDAFLPPLT